MLYKNIFLFAKGDYRVGTANESETYGGVNLHLNFADQMIDDLVWLRELRAQTNKEKELRASNPALESAWQQYQTMLNILLDTN